MQSTFEFDGIFGEECTQDRLFRSIAEPILEDVLNGYNGTIIAYGQTGSGKTHSMTGALDSTSQMGIIPRCIHSIFSHIEESSEDLEFTLKCSYIEIYMENVLDLLNGNFG